MTSFLQEALKFNRLDPQDSSTPPPADSELSSTPEDETDLASDYTSPDDASSTPADSAADEIANLALEDPNKQGIIRRVAGAHLVYKRESDNNTFTELWVYRADDVKQCHTTRRSILAGTDIVLPQMSSEDGQQQFTTWSVGNMEMMQITGLAN